MFKSLKSNTPESSIRIFSLIGLFTAVGLSIAGLILDRITWPFVGVITAFLSPTAGKVVQKYFETKSMSDKDFLKSQDPPEGGGM